MSGPLLAVVGEGLVELALDRSGAAPAPAPGGDAGNIAAMAARLGVRARLGGRVGADPLGELLCSFWQRCGVDTGHVVRDPAAPTGLYLNAATPDGHAFTYWRHGSAGSRLAPGDLGEEFLDGAGILAVTGVTLAVSASSAAAVDAVVRRARERAVRVACVLNHRPALGGDIDALAALAATADVVIGSTEDALAVFGTASPVRLQAGPLPVAELVLTDGSAPVAAIAGGVRFEQPVPAVPVVNAAGAGDAFAGAYLARRLGGDDPGAALAWGAAAASRSVARAGCAASYPSRAETAALADDLLAA